MQINETVSGGIDKASRYGWNITDEPGRLMMIDKSDLQIDESYQRTTTDSKVNRIAAKWSWVACGALIVACRGGQFFVIDGQHRAQAAMKLAAVKQLPCVVFETEGSREEAEGFLRSNKDRKPMTAVQAFSAMVVAGDRDAIFVHSLVNDFGLYVTSSASSSSSFMAPGVLLQIARRDHGKARRVLSAAIAACHGGHVHSAVLKGLSWIDDAAQSEKLLPRMESRLRVIGREQILRSIGNAKALRGAGGEKVCAEGILSAYNHRLRNKIDLL